MKIFVVSFLTTAFVVIILGLGWIFLVNTPPGCEGVRRQTLEESRTYNAGAIQKIRSAQVPNRSGPQKTPPQDPLDGGRK